MKKITYAITVFILLTVFLVNGEMFKLYGESVEAIYDSIVIAMEDNVDNKDVTNEVIEIGKKYEVSVFVVDNVMKSEKKLEKTFHIDNNTWESISKENKISKGEYKSFFGGNYDIKVKGIDEISYISPVKEYYVLGENENISKFRDEISSIYNVKDFYEGIMFFDIDTYIIAIWIISGILIVLLNGISIVFGKKENTLKCVYGESKLNVIFKNTVKDILFLIMASFFAIFIMSNFTYTFYNIKLNIICMVVIFICLIFQNIFMSFGEIKKIFLNIKVSKKMYILTYSLKIMSGIFVTVVISMCIIMILKGTSEFEKKEYYEHYKDYYYVNIGFEYNEEDYNSIYECDAKQELIREVFDRKFYSEYDVSFMIDMWQDGNSIYANKNVLWYLKEKIKEINNKELDKEIYFIVPVGTTDVIIENMKDNMKFYEGLNYKYTYEIIYYKENINILAFDETIDSGSVFKDNPFILLNNMDKDKVTYDIQTDTVRSLYQNETMYKINKESFNEFIKEYGITESQCTFTNVWESYEYEWYVIKQSFTFFSMLAILFYIIEMIIINYIIKMEYDINASELAIKKVMGYSIWEKNKKLLIISIGSSVLALLGAVGVAYIMDISGIIYIILGGSILLISEVILIVRNIRKIEKGSIQKILKGGAL